MSDLVVNIPAVTVTAEKPKLTTREDFTNLKRYADAFRRGEIGREKIPYKYRAHLPETQEKAQGIAYQQHKDDEKAQEILKRQGWDKLEKAYGIGMSSLVAVPALSQVAASAVPGWTSFLLPTFNPNFVPFGQIREENHSTSDDVTPPYRREYTPIEILKDPATRNFQEKVVASNHGKPVDLDFTTDVRGFKSKCARYVKDLAYRASGINPENTGVYGNAWNIYGNIMNSGGSKVFNIYETPYYRDIAKNGDTYKLKKTTRNLRDSLKTLYGDLRVGDVVGIEMPNSDYQNEALKTGATYNSHVGIVSNLEDGIPIIAHTMHGINLRDPITKLSGNNFYDPIVTVGVRPAYISGTTINFDDFKSQYKLPFEPDETNEVAVSQFQEYMNSLASAKEAYKKLYPDVDWNALEKAAIGMMKRETRYMQRKQSDLRSGRVGEFSDFIMSNARKAAHTVLHTPESRISGDLTKMKFATLPKIYRSAIGLHTPSQLDTDPTVTARAVLLQLGRMYDYFNRLNKTYPQLKLSEDDKLNASIWSYNEGPKWHLGFNKYTNEHQPEEIELLRKISDKNWRTKNYKDTNYKYLGALGEYIFDKYGEDYPGYIASARTAMDELENKEK